MDFLRQLCNIQAPSGSEDEMTAFVLEFIGEHSGGWQVQPEIFHGQDFQNCIVLVFGKPRTMVFAHMDNIGFTVRYNHELVRIGSPDITSGILLSGKDKSGMVTCELAVDSEKKLFYTGSREIERGTPLSFVPDWRETDEYVQCCYLDNRLGVWNALRLCETLENGAVVFSCWEEHGGGSVAFLTRFLFEKYGIRQALISDITWITEGVRAGNGAVISLRDSGIPRKNYIDKITSFARESGIAFQLEVEASGGSDGTEIQKLPYPVDWCFIGAGEMYPHSPNEKVHKSDIRAMTDLYRYLMKAI